MQTRAVIVLLVALIMGGIAVALVNNMLQRQEGTGGSAVSVEVQPVVVAKVNLEVGTRLEEVMLKTVEWPKANLPEGTYGDIKAVIGEEPPVLLKEVHAGEPILPYKLSNHGARGGLTYKIPENMRAITIPVNEVRGVAGFVLPGDRVDVLLTSAGGRGAGPTTNTLLQNVVVLAVAQTTSEKADQPKVVSAVTLLVSPEQGHKLTLAQRVGELTLLLRTETDVAPTSAPAGGVTVADLVEAEVLIPDQVEEEEPPPRPRGSTVQVLRGLSMDKQRVNQ